MAKIYSIDKDSIIEMPESCDRNAGEYAPWFFLIKIIGFVIFAIICIIVN